MALGTHCYGERREPINVFRRSFENRLALALGTTR